MTNPVLLERKRARLRVALDGEVAPIYCEGGEAGSVAEQIARVSRWLGTFGLTLASDPVVLLKHGTQLAKLDWRHGLWQPWPTPCMPTLGKDRRASAGRMNSAPELHSASSARSAKLASQCSPI